MSDRIANVTVLVEDRIQQNLVRRYLQRLWGDHYDERRMDYRPLAAGRGSGEQFVRRDYARLVGVCRWRRSKASCLLIVMIDADNRSTVDRQRQLSDELSIKHMPQRGDDEPIVVLIPKRHVETWIRASSGEIVDEVTSYKQPEPTREKIRHAAATLFNWTRPGATPGATSTPSLTASIPEWRRVG